MLACLPQAVVTADLDDALGRLASRLYRLTSLDFAVQGRRGEKVRVVKDKNNDSYTEDCCEIF